MNPDEYRAAKARSGITVADNWCAATRMTKDQDKAYSSGRTVIPDVIATNVRILVDLLSARGRILADNIRTVLPNCTVDFNDSTGAITLTFPTTKIIQIECAGVDTMNLAPVYVAARSTKNEAIFIFFGEESPAKPKYIEGERWFLWRGNFPENRNVPRFRNYFNKIDEPLLTLAFSAYA
jgi:hypothetical protein